MFWGGILLGKYTGPKKLKASGKAAGRKKKKQDKKDLAAKVKRRHRDKKNIGKRRRPSNAVSESIIKEGGWGTLKKRVLPKNKPHPEKE